MVIRTFGNADSREADIDLGGDWSSSEVEAVVADHFAMLVKELRGEPFSKAAHRRTLAAVLDNRSDGSIEFKHQNISAILIEHNYPYISGYKPRANYQRLLSDAVGESLQTDSDFESAVHAAVDAPAVAPSVDDILGRLVAAPEHTDRTYPLAGESARGRAPVRSVNYLEREARNTSLGRAGEEFVLAFERARLVRGGYERLASRVEHVSVTEGDGLGFDIRSFEPDGSDRLVEVKTTAYGRQTPFFLSRNEVEVSRIHDERYYLYRVFGFRRDPRLYTLSGALERICSLQPIQFAARIG